MTLRRSDEPIDALTELGNKMLGVLGDAEVHAIVCLRKDERVGLSLYGYEDDDDALFDLLEHARTILQAHGGDLTIYRPQLN